MENTEILEKLVKRTTEYLQNDMGIDINDSCTTIKSVDQIEYFDITAHIALSSDIRATVGMSTSNKFACTLVKKFLSIEIAPSEMAELAAENIAETLNITMGNILKDLTVMKEGGNINISIPHTLYNAVVVKRKKNGMMYISKLRSNDEEILLSYFL